MSHIMVVRLATFAPLTEPQRDVVTKYVNDTWGYKSFHPSALNLLQKELKLGEKQYCTALYEILKLIVQHEHVVASMLLSEMMGADVNPDVNLEKSLTPFALETLDQIHACKKDKSKSLVLGVLQQLQVDLYLMRDYEHLLPPETPSTPPEPDIEHSETPTSKSFKVPNLLRHLFPTGPQSVDFSTALVLLDDEYRYMGHIYVWPADYYADTAEAIGIRTSLLNLACRLVPGIGRKLVLAVYDYAVLHGFHNIVILNPLGPMGEILKALGFVQQPNVYMAAKTEDVAKIIRGSGDGGQGRKERKEDIKRQETTYSCEYPNFTAIIPTLAESKELAEEVLFLSKRWHANPRNVKQFLMLRYQHRLYNPKPPKFMEYVEFLDMSNLMPKSMREQYNAFLAGAYDIPLIEV